jgi:hypothetical protein
MTAPEWAELARSELSSDITQGAARGIDKDCRRTDYYLNLTRRQSALKTMDRIDSLIKVAVQYIGEGAPSVQDGFLHRLAKFDTSCGKKSLTHAALENVPYAVLLYERYLGRPFAAHRDAVSELVGEVMENAIEHRLRNSGVSYRKTGRAEKFRGSARHQISVSPMRLIPQSSSRLKSRVTMEQFVTRWQGSRNWKPRETSMCRREGPGMRWSPASTAGDSGREERICAF